MISVCFQTQMADVPHDAHTNYVSAYNAVAGLTHKLGVILVMKHLMKLLWHLRNQYVTSENKERSRDEQHELTAVEITRQSDVIRHSRGTFTGSVR